MEYAVPRRREITKHTTHISLFHLFLDPVNHLLFDLQKLTTTFTLLGLTQGRRETF